MTRMERLKFKHISINSKLNFPDFSTDLSSCFDNCAYGSLTNLCYASNNLALKLFQKDKYAGNTKLLNSKNFVKVLRNEILLSNFRKFRFFSFGDLYKIEHLEKIETLIRSLPKIEFWLSTHSDKILSEYYFDKLPLENLNVILSNKLPNTQAPKFLKDWAKSKNISISNTTNIKKESNCHSSKDKKPCGSCENCFNGMDITYYLHGKFAEKRLKKYEENKNEKSL